VLSILALVLIIVAKVEQVNEGARDKYLVFKGVIQAGIGGCCGGLVSHFTRKTAKLENKAL